jgi:hypothetical protein
VIIINLTEFNAKLPPEASFSADAGLFWKKIHVGNFVPVVIGKADVESDEKTETYVRFHLLFTDGAKSEVNIVALSDLGNADYWFDLNLRCQIDPDCTRAKQYLLNIVRFALPFVPVNALHFIDRLGTNIINGTPVFCTGGRLYWPPGKENTDIILKLPSRILAIDPELTEREAVVEMLELVNLSPEAGKMIFTYCLSSVIRAVYADAWKAPCGVLFVIANSGEKKTIYTSLQAQLYDRDKGFVTPTQLNASFAAVKTILSAPENSDCAALFDDLFPTGSNRIKRDLEELFRRLLRFIGNQKSPARMYGKEVSEKAPQCGVIVTGEYEIGTGSEAARCLIVKISTPLDRIKLQECWDKPLAASTFYHFFIQWYISKYHEIRDVLKKWLNDYRNLDFGVHDRLQEMHYGLSSAYKLFLCYCVEKAFTSIENAQAQQRSFEKLLTNLVLEQDNRVQQGKDNTSEKIDFLELIRALYKNDVFRLAKSGKRFDSEPEKYDGVVYGGLLCLRGEKLLAKINRTVPCATLKDVKSSLLSGGALWLDGEGKNKKVGQRRFVGIRLKKLK